MLFIFLMWKSSKAPLHEKKAHVIVGTVILCRLAICPQKDHCSTCNRLMIQHVFYPRLDQENELVDCHFCLIFVLYCFFCIPYLFNVHIPASYRIPTYRKLESDTVAPFLSAWNSTLETNLKNHISFLFLRKTKNTLIFWQENIFFGTLQFQKSQREENHLKRISDPPQWRIPLPTPKLFWLMTSSITGPTLWSLEGSGSNER